jgi:hypothetical protein
MTALLVLKPSLVAASAKEHDGPWFNCRCIIIIIITLIVDID